MLTRILKTGYLILACCCVMPGLCHSGQTTLAIGRATEDVVDETKRLKPIVTYLSSRLAPLGIEKGRVFLVSNGNADEIAGHMRKGTLDMVIDSVFPANALKQSNAAKVILTASRKGKKEYHSYIFTRRDNGITNIEGLKGKVMVFEDPCSTSAYLLPRLHMESKGLVLERLDAVDASVPHDRIGFLFGNSEINVSGWVFFKKACAGALSNLDWEDPSDVPENFKRQFRIIGETPRVPSLMVMIRKDMDPVLEGRIKAVLENMHHTPDGAKALLESTFRITGFHGFDTDPLDTLEQLYPSLKTAAR